MMCKRFLLLLLLALAFVVFSIYFLCGLRVEARVFQGYADRCPENKENELEENHRQDSEKW